MALSPSLQQFKSSGVYRLEFDKSQIINIPAETIRLVIGFSKKGPFNTPVFVQDSVFFRTVFGDIDTTLERKGSFFHRTVLTCLTRGPVIVLNLLKLTDADTSQFTTVSTSSTMANNAVQTAPVKEFFNTDKFWFTDPRTFVEYANQEQPFTKKLLNLANVGRKTISVITKKSDVLGFDILAKDWFQVGQIPEYMNENDYISDYMIDLIIVEGDFSNYQSLSIDPIFGPYFTTTGLKRTYVDQFGFTRDGLSAFLALDNVNVLGVYTGALAPEFQSKNGENLYIQDLVNLETSKTGLLLGYDNEFLDDEPLQVSGDFVDLIGHTIESEDPATIDFLSYYGPVTETLEYDNESGVSTYVIAATAGQTGANVFASASTAIQGATGWSAGLGLYDTLTFYGPAADAVTNGDFAASFATVSDLIAFVDSLTIGNVFVNSQNNFYTGPSSTVNYSKIIDFDSDISGQTITVQISLTVGAGVTGPTNIANSYMSVANGGSAVTAAGGTGSIYVNLLDQVQSNNTDLYAIVNSDLYQANLNGIVIDGDKICTNGTDFAWAEFTRLSTNLIGTLPTGESPGPASVLSHEVNYIVVDAYENEDLTGATAIQVQTTYEFTSLVGSINESLPLWLGVTYTNPTTTVWLDNSASGPYGLGGFTGKIKKGQYIVMNHGGTGTPTDIDPNTGKSRLTKIISVQEDSNPLSTTYQKIKVTTNQPIFIKSTNEIERYKSVDNFATHYRFHVLSGYTLTADMLPNGTLDRQNEILDVMYDTGIYNALIDREVITYRYIIDTFEGGIEPASKVKLTRLAKAQQSSLAICNMPSVKQFRDSTNPLFKFDSTSSFEARYIADGGNLDLNPSNIFSLPGIADGANYSAFYGPNLTIRENGTNKSIPPAAHVSNLYIDKYNLALPYSIVAGPRRGVVTGEGIVGVEYAFDRTDLDAIEPFGYNAILNKRGFGLVINANQTAQQTVKSALSQIHVRELLIYIQDGIEAILKNYRWEFNTAQNRLEIKTLADNFLTQILSDGGVYDFQNVMDSSNNTPEIIDSNIGILDTYVEPVRGMGILIHRTTILRTGAIATGNFI
jgi:hypothetical protein